MGQPVAALGAALRAHDPGRAQLREDVLQEGHRDVLGLRQLIDLAGGILATGGQLHGRSHGVVGLGGDVHRTILPETAAEGDHGI